MPENVGFLPEDYVEKRVARRTNAICITLFIVVMISVVAAFWVTDRQRSAVRRQQAQVNKQFENAARRLEQLQELQSQKTQMVRKAKVASVLVERVPRTLLLSELVNHMPRTLSLLNMELQTHVVKRASRPRTAMQREQAKARRQGKGPRIRAPQTEVGVKLVGVAPSDVAVARFITALSQHPLFTDVNLQYSEQTKVQDQEMRKFALWLKVNQNIDTRDIKPMMVKRKPKMNPMGDTLRLEPPGSQRASHQTPIQPAVDAP